jgi:hypothetical protein
VASISPSFWQDGYEVPAKSVCGNYAGKLVGRKDWNLPPLGPEFSNLRRLQESDALHGRPGATTGRAYTEFVEPVGYLLWLGEASIANVCNDRNQIFVAFGVDRAANSSTGGISLLRDAAHAVQASALPA